MDIQQLLGYLQNPQEEFTPIPFWFFNDKPDRKIIKQQLEDFTDKGVNALVLHPRIGIPEEIPYLSKAYFDAVRYVVETAAGLGMKIVLYDEGMYPSGSAHGIWLMGHPAESDDVEEELYFHVPGQDLIMRRVSPETGGLLEPDSVQAKLPADIARHLGRKRNANECFGVCCRHQIPWYFTGMDMKWYINWLGIRGVNLFIPHAFYYSVEGQRKEERPPDVGPNNIWWNHYRLFSDYIKRISSLIPGMKRRAF